MSLYCFFRDFAGPLATISAAGAAVLVTFALGRRQAAAAERQSETARNKLMADIFDRRFAAYEGAMRAAEITLFDESDNRLSNASYHGSSYKALQGEFLFLPEVFSHIKEIVDLSFDLIGKEGRLKRMSPTNTTHDQRDVEVDTMHSRLLELRRNLAAKVRPYMRLDFQ